MASILFLHGMDARPGGIKPTFLAAQGHCVFNPLLPREDFDQSVSIAQNEFDQHRPDVIVGSSRGGAVALAIQADETPLVLLAPAWKFFFLLPKGPSRLRILHSPNDQIIPFHHSQELQRLWPDTDAVLFEVGSDHTMTDPQSLQELDRIVREVTTT